MVSADGRQSQIRIEHKALKSSVLRLDEYWQMLQTYLTIPSHIMSMLSILFQLQKMMDNRAALLSDFYYRNVDILSFY